MPTHTLRRLAARCLAPLWLAALLTGCAGPGPGQAPALRISNAQVGGSVVSFDSESSRFALGDWKGDIGVWSLPGGELQRRWRAHAGTVNGLVFLDRKRDRDRRILSGGYDGDLAEWDAQGRLLRRVATGSPITALVAVQADDTVITGHADGSVGVWALSRLRARHRYPVHRGAVHAVAYLPGRQWLASSGGDQRVFLWRAADAAPTDLPGPPTVSRALQFSPDGRWLIGGGWFRLFRWELADATLTSLPTEHHGIIKSLQYSPDGAFLASISRKTDSAVYFLDPRDGRTLRRFQQHALCGGWVALSPDGRYLASTSDDASVQVWRLDAAEAEASH
ncbi:MAG: WD40 repeat domain-containing protein [Gammaproteobacteria bacterium]